MAYNVSSAFREQLYSGESNFRAILTIGENTIDNDQIASISISSPIIDDSKQVFYVGTFISQKITIKFKNMDGIDVHSGDNVDLSIGQYVNNEWVDVPIGKFLVDDLAEDYFEKCEISCLDYAVKFKPNIDYSLCFTDGKATIKEILEYICDYFNVEIGDYPTINDDVEIGTYDSTVSGKQWISYIAELKGCNAKIDRLGRLTLQPLKQSSNVPINALESASFELGEEFNITKVTFFDAIRNYTYGDDEGNTLFIRQDNPFITDTKVVQNIYDNLCVDKYSASGKSFDIEDADAHPINVNTIYGETSQETYTGKNLLNPFVTSQTFNGITSTYDELNQTVTFNGTCTTDNSCFGFTKSGTITLNGTYTLSYEVLGGTISNTKATTKIQIQQTSNWASISVPLKQTSSSNTQNVSISCNANNIRFDNGVVVNNYKIRIQLEKNNSKTSWEKYVGGTPSPNPDFPQNINTVTGGNVFNIKGKNLFNISLYDNSDKTGQGTVSNDGDTITFTSANTDSYTPSMWSETQFYDHRKMAMPCEPNTTYTLSFDVDSTPNGCIYVYEGDKDFKGIKRNDPAVRYDNATRIKTFTTSSNTHYLIFRIVLWAVATVNISNIQLEKGSSKTEYEPYQNQSYELDLGKNLYNESSVPMENGNFNYNTGVNMNNNTRIRVRSYIPCKPNTTYTISINEPIGEIGVVYKEADGETVINGFGYGVSTKYCTFTTPNNAYYLRFRFGNETYPKREVNNYQVQLEEGSIATEYAPYYTVSKNLLNFNLLKYYNRNAYSYSIVNDNAITIVTSTSSTYQSVFFDLDLPDGTFTLSSRALNNGTTSGNVGIGVEWYLKGATSRSGFGELWINATDRQNATRKTTTFTVDNTTYDYKLRLFGSQNTAVANTTEFVDVMLYEGNNTSEYEPYDKHLELCKIGDYQDYITRNTGKNIVDVNNSVYGAILANDTTGVLDNVSSHTAITSEWVPCKPNTTYIISGQNNRYRWQTKDINGTITFVPDNPRITTNSTATYMRVYYYYNGTPTQDISSIKIQIEEGSTATEYEPYGKDKWYLHKEIGKYTFTGANNENWTRWDNKDATKKSFATNILLNEIVKPLNDDTICNIYSNYYSAKTINDLYKRNITGIGIQQTAWIRIFNEQLQSSSLEDWKTWLSTHNTIVEYPLATPTNTEITYTPLIEQLNALQNAGLFEGINHITIDTLNEVPTIDIDYYKNSHFNLWSLKTHNYGDFTLDAWDNIDYDLDGTHYLTLNNNTIKYEMSIMSDVESKIPTKQQEVTTNVIGGDDKTNIKIIKTNVDQLNASVDILSQQQTDTQTDVSQLQIDVNGINTTVEHIENVEITGLQSEISSVNQTVSSIANLFQITGGINKIRNSAFLLPDEVWEFTDSGTNPEHTNLGNSYNSTLSGRTISIAEIKARSTKIKSKSENITDLKTDGTKYTFNFYHKQDVDTTTTIKMYSTENNNIKAFNDIVITGQQPFTNYEVSFVPTYTNYTLEIIITNATSIGYAYLYDMMLNSGDKQPWQPASDEIYSTTLQMSRLGLQVYSVGDGTLTILGSDGLTSWETSDGRTKGRLVSKRTVDGDRVKVVTTQSVKLVSDATKTDEELAQEDKWVETTTKVSGKIAKVIYMESGVQ